MYTQHFRLTELPFSIAPNPRYLYLSAQHREALAHLLYGIGVGGGFVVLTGEVGTGKTTLCRALLDQLPEDVDIALIFNPRLNSRELLAGICDELHIPYPGPRASLKQLIDALNGHLLDAHARGRRVIVLIDEAQNLRFDVLEQVRLLTNLETNQTKLLQIILVGQPELNQVLDRPNLRQLSQRITARYHLNPLTLAETRDYIRHRLKVAGGSEQEFTDAAMRAIHRRAHGIPRLINLMSDRALLGAYTLGKLRVTGPIARRASRELMPAGKRRNAWRVPGLLALLALSLLGAMAMDVIPNPFTRLLGQSEPGLSLTAGTVGKAHGVRQAIDEKSKAAEATAAPDNNPEKGRSLPLAQPDFAHWLETPGLDDVEAIRTLLSLWSFTPEDSGIPACDQAKTQGLRCLPLQGYWIQMKSLNLPAMMEFLRPDGQRRTAVLTRVEGDTMELSNGKVSGKFGTGEVLPLWTGGGTIVWKPPTDEKALVMPGTRSPSIVWIRDQLGADLSPGADKHLYDDGLKQRVINFQKMRGLDPDGIIGQLTLLHLQTARENPGIPVLDKSRP